jgi:hypothetical protein
LELGGQGLLEVLQLHAHARIVTWRGLDDGQQFPS